MERFRKAVVATLLLFISTNAYADWTTNGKGFNFRSNLSFVTDATYDTHVRGSTAGGGLDDYPQTRTVDGDNVTFGWSAGTVVPADRDATVADPRLAGINYVTPGTTGTFQVDLPSTGTYEIRLANGDTGGSQGVQRVEFFDNTTSLAVISDTAVAQDNYNDANGVNQTEAAWPGSNTARCFTFATTTFKMTIGSGSTDYVVVAHLDIKSVASCGGGGGGSTSHNLGTLGVGK